MRGVEAILQEGIPHRVVLEDVVPEQIVPEDAPGSEYDVRRARFEALVNYDSFAKERNVRSEYKDESKQSG